jgi:tol-pal system protein YbgF
MSKDVRAAAWGRIAAALAVTWLLAACGASRDDVLQIEASSRDEHAEMRQSLAGLQQSIDQLTTAIRQLRADLDARLDEVNNRMGIVESLMRDNEQMFQRFQTRLQQAQERQRQLEEGDTLGLTSPAPPPGEAPAGRPGTAPDTTGRAAAPPGRGGIPSEIDLYNAALNDYQAGRFDLALNGFREYLRLYPDGASPDNAQFWIGKIYLDQKQYEAAARELERLMASYPETDKAAQATFYLGNAYRALGNEERARTYYRQVIERYPTSQESQLARRELER